MTTQKSLWLLGWLLLILFISACSNSAAVSPTSVPPTATPATSMTITFADGKCTYDGPKSFPTGSWYLNVEAKDVKYDAYGVGWATFDQGKTIDDLKAQMPNPDQPSWAHLLTFSEIKTVGKETFQNIVLDGPVYFVCFTKTPLALIGVFGPIAAEKPAK